MHVFFLDAKWKEEAIKIMIMIIIIIMMITTDNEALLQWYWCGEMNC
jgi:hypothetical protein